MLPCDSFSPPFQGVRQTLIVYIIFSRFGMPLESSRVIDITKAIALSPQNNLHQIIIRKKVASPA